MWTSEISIWSGRRNFVDSDNNSSMTLDGVDARDSLQSHETLQSTMPSWCSFVGMTSCMFVLRRLMTARQCDIYSDSVENLVSQCGVLISYAFISVYIAVPYLHQMMRTV